MSIIQPVRKNFLHPLLDLVPFFHERLFGGFNSVIDEVNLVSPVRGRDDHGHYEHIVSSISLSALVYCHQPLPYILPLVVMKSYRNL